MIFNCHFLTHDVVKLRYVMEQNVGEVKLLE